MMDKSSEITHKTAKILEIHKDISDKLRDYLDTEPRRPDVSYELLKMLVIIDELLEYVNPSKTTGEIFGLPKEASFGSKNAYDFSNEHGWDFGPWFLEKATNVKNGVLSTFKYWDTDPDKVELKEDAPMTPKEWVKDGIDSGLHSVKVYAEAIFKMVCTDKITVESMDNDG